MPAEPSASSADSSTAAAAGPRMRRLTMDLCDCTACEACTSLAPEHFGWDENTERPHQLQELVPADLAQDVVSFCPQGCIYFDDEEGSGPRGY